MLLAERAITKMKYVSLDDKKDCLAFAMLDLLKYWRGFNPKYKKLGLLGYPYWLIFEWAEPLTKAPSHRLLAMLRAENEGFVKIKIEICSI